MLYLEREMIWEDKFVLARKVMGVEYDQRT
jgi:hypothetical protein